MDTVWRISGNRPIIFGPPEKTYGSGENFTLICSGDKPLSWTYPESVSFLTDKQTNKKLNFLSKLFFLLNFQGKNNFSRND